MYKQIEKMKVKISNFLSLRSILAIALFFGVSIFSQAGRCLFVHTHDGEIMDIYCKWTGTCLDDVIITPEDE